jgi:hypothetical protein
MNKLCKWCKEDKPLTEFNKHTDMPDGHLNKCKKCVKQYKKAYYQKNKNGVIREAKLRNKENYKLAKRTKKYKTKRNASRRDRYKRDIKYRIVCILRARLKAALKGKAKKGIKTLNSIGCSVEKLKQHIEKQFKPGMSWQNWGEWHIDHIRPLASFNLPKELKKANNYKNLRPLWAEENFKKGCRYGIS